MNSRCGNMKVLNEVEKELLKIIIDNKKSDYDSSFKINGLPSYISSQIKDLLANLKNSGYCAAFNVWIDGSCQVTLTSLGISYFDKEDEYINSASNNNFNIGTINLNDSNLNLGIINNSTSNINSSYTELERLIEEKGENEKSELYEILTQVKEYIENINETKIVEKNKNLFTKIGVHIKKHQWFYHEIVTLVGKTILNVMSDN